MKVLQIIADGNAGGGTTNVLGLSRDLRDSGVEVTFCSQKSSYALDSARALGLEVYDGIDFFRHRLDRRVVADVSAAIDHANPDVIHVHGARAGLAWLRGSARASRRRTIYTVRGYQFWKKPGVLRFLAKQVERRLSRSVYQTVHVSQSDQNTALQNSFVADSAATRVIRNGVTLAEIPAPEASPRSRRHQVAVLGRLTTPKNPHLVLDLAKQLATENFVFHLIGGGDLEVEIRNRIACEQIDNAIVYGQQSRAQGLSLMSQMGTFLMASLWEGLPLAPVEAMAMGLAVVISDVNGCTEVVRDGIEGRVAPSANRDAFAAALRAVVAEPERSDALVENGKQRVVTEFSSERVLRQHLELYRECVEAAA